MPAYKVFYRIRVNDNLHTDAAMIVEADNAKAARKIVDEHLIAMSLPTTPTIVKVEQV